MEYFDLQTNIVRVFDRFYEELFSELTLDNEEFLNLIEFIQNNYEPFKHGTKAFIPLVTYKILILNSVLNSLLEV